MTQKYCRQPSKWSIFSLTAGAGVVTAGVWPPHLTMLDESLAEIADVVTKIVRNTYNKSFSMSNLTRTAPISFDLSKNWYRKPG